jgi:hypothetical protein
MVLLLLAFQKAYNYFVILCVFCMPGDICQLVQQSKYFKHSFDHWDLDSIFIDPYKHHK